MPNAVCELVELMAKASLIFGSSHHSVQFTAEEERLANRTITKRVLITIVIAISLVIPIAFGGFGLLF